MRTNSSYAVTGSPKIVLLIGSFGRGGAERQSFLIARELRARYELNVEVWALTYDGEYADEFRQAGIPTRALEFRPPRCPIPPVRFSYWIARVLDIARELRKEQVDVLLPFTVWPNVLAGLIYRLAGVRLCIWGERSAGSEKMPGLTRLAVRQYRRFVANSTAGVEFLADQLGVDRRRISFIPNGVEEPEIELGATDWRTSLGIDRDQLLVVKVANLTRYKDHPTLLRAWKLVQESWGDGVRPVLALAGYFGPAYEECQQIVTEAGLDSTVRFLGGITDVPALLEACDLTVFSSPKEGMPNGVLECMAAGKAVIASDLPGVRDVLGPNAADVLVPPGDVNGFAGKLLDVLRNGDRRNALGKANQARMRSEFSIERLGRRYFDAISESLPNTAGDWKHQPRHNPGAERVGEVSAIDL